MAEIRLGPSRHVTGARPVKVVNPVNLVELLDAWAASRGDAVLVALAALHGVAFLAIPTSLSLALGLWWNSNTISHNFIHRPFFRRPLANRLFAAYQSILLGIPQSLWRDRHLAHHAGAQCRLRVSGELAAEMTLVLSLWALIAVRAPRFFVSVYLPGYVAGLLLCALHGHFEHARGTASHYGTIYNLLFFNDGYHAEHHAHPEVHWTRLPRCHEPATPASAWPAPLRWVEVFSLHALEGLVLRSRILQRFVLRNHAHALGGLLGALPTVGRITIVGGGLFPRTALILRRLLPTAHLTIIDSSRSNLDRSRGIVGDANIEFVHAVYPESGSAASDLLVIPLSFDGDRAAIYARPPAPAVIVHDWIWRQRGESRVVSMALLKRVNLVRP